MFRRSIPFVKETVLFAGAFLLMEHQVLAGEVHRSATLPATPTRSQPVSVAVPHARPQVVTITIVVPEPPPPATEPLIVSLHGPDGQVRRFAVEGGRGAIQARRIVLRPGESVTIPVGPAN